MFVLKSRINMLQIKSNIDAPVTKMHTIFCTNC